MSAAARCLQYPRSYGQSQESPESSPSGVIDAVACHFFQFFLAVIYLSALKNRIAEIALVCPYIHVYSFSGGSEIVLLPFYHKYTLLSIALVVNCFIVVGVEEKAGTPVLPVKVHELLE